MRDYFEGRICTRRQLAGICSHPIIAVIPPITAAASVSRLLTDLTHGTSRQTKSEGAFLKLRDALRATEDGRTSTTLLITSSGAGEGKSTVAVNLALASMRDGERVLLIDADFRNRTISRQLAAQAMFQTQAGQERPGLGDILKGLSTFEASTTFLPKAKLAVLAAGSTEGVKTRVDRAWLAEKVFSKCRQFDLVIVDCGDAPTDRFVRGLAAVVETIIIVVRAGRTRLEDLELAATALRDASARIQGIVLNEARG
jgi:Mrp family chromosome partitioning ATPase